MSNEASRIQALEQQLTRIQAFEHEVKKLKDEQREQAKQIVLLERETATLQKEVKALKKKLAK